MDGIEFPAKTTLSPTYPQSGSWGFCQLDALSYSLIMSNGSSNVDYQIVNYGHQGLDDGFLYPFNGGPYSLLDQIYRTQDGPYVTLTYSDGQSGDTETSATCSGVFKMYVMYLPPGKGSLYVPLDLIGWSWNDTATLNGNIWITLPTAPTVDKAQTNTSSHPAWTIVRSNSDGFVPK